MMTAANETSGTTKSSRDTDSEKPIRTAHAMSINTRPATLSHSRGKSVTRLHDLQPEAARPRTGVLNPTFVSVSIAVMGTASGATIVCQSVLWKSRQSMPCDVDETLLVVVNFPPAVAGFCASRERDDGTAMTAPRWS